MSNRENIVWPPIEDKKIAKAVSKAFESVIEEQNIILNDKNSLILRLASKDLGVTPTELANQLMITQLVSIDKQNFAARQRK